MKQNHVARQARILDDLQRDAVVIFGAVHETGGAFGRIAFGVEVTNVRVTQEQPAIVSAARSWGWRIVPEVLVNQAVRTRDNQRPAAARRDVAQQRVRPDSGRWRKGTQVIRVSMPAASRYIPRMDR